MSVKYGLKVVWESRLRLAKDVDDRAAIGQREHAVSRLLLAPRQHLPHPVVLRIAGESRHGVERGRVDDVAARVLKQSPSQIEVTERSSLFVAWTCLRESFGES